MGYPITQSQTALPLVFRLVSLTDHITGLTGKAATVVVKISKVGAPGVTPAGAISEIDSTNLPGWYAVAGNATDSGSLGPIILYAKDAASDPVDDVFNVVAYNGLAVGNLGLSNLDAAISSRSTYAGGAVASVTAPVTVGTNSDKTGYTLSAPGITSVVNGTWDELRGGHLISGSFGAFIDAAISSRGTFSGGAVSSVTGSVGSIAGITFPGSFGLLAIDGSGRVTTSAASVPVDTGTVTGTTSATVFTASSSFGAGSGAYNPTPQRVRFLYWTSGANKGLLSAVQVHSVAAGVTTFTLAAPPPGTVAVNDTYDVF